MRLRKFGCVRPAAHPPVRPRLQTRGKGEGDPNAIRPGGGGGGGEEMSAISSHLYYAQSCEICIFRRDYVINHLQQVQSNVLQ